MLCAFLCEYPTYTSVKALVPVRLRCKHTPTSAYLLDVSVLQVLLRLRLPLSLTRSSVGREINMMGHSAGCQGNTEKAQLGGRI